MLGGIRLNNGYIGYSRSVRSEEAIGSFEIPLSMFNKNTIQKFLEENRQEFTIYEIEILGALSIAKWKYVAEYQEEATSWHHTGKFFNKTNHYDLLKVALKILELSNDLNDMYQKYLSDKQDLANETPHRFGVIEVQVWGGSRKRPKLLGTERFIGICYKNWFFYRDGNFLESKIRKFNPNGNRVVSLKTYDSYVELVNNHKEYKNHKKFFNQLIKEVKGL